MTLRTMLAVAAGGLLGTALRLGLDTLLPHTREEFPLSTLLVNVAGSLVLGILVARVWPVAPGWLRAGLGAGVLGSFTTFSAVAVAMIELPVATAALFLALTVVLGLLAAVVGLRLGRRPDAANAPTIDPVQRMIVRRHPARRCRRRGAAVGGDAGVRAAAVPVGGAHGERRGVGARRGAGRTGRG